MSTTLKMILKYLNPDIAESIVKKDGLAEQAGAIVEIKFPFDLEEFCREMDAKINRLREYEWKYKDLCK